jgi:Uma2 family endonuclease
MPTVATQSATDVEPRRFTSDEVQAMLQAGILHEDDRVELINGQLIPMAPIGNAHIACVNRLNRLFVERTTSEIAVSVQNPVRIDEYNEPQPDLVLSTALDRAPEPGDVLLIVEVADSSLTYDRETNLPLYAQAGIPEVWIANLAEAQVEIHREPSGSVYRTRHLAGPGDRVSVEGRASVSGLPVRDILGPSSAAFDDAESTS